jgi:hypothetical protein
MSDAAQVIVTEQGEAAVILAVPGVQGQGGQDVTDLSYNPSTRVLSSSTGTGTTLPLATTTLPGLESPEDKIKLDSVQAGAQPNVNADWNSTSGNAQILNKPVLGGAAALDVGSTAGTVAAGDDGRFATNLDYNAETLQIASSTGSSATLTLVTATQAGLIPAPPEGDPTGKVFDDSLQWVEPSGGASLELVAISYTTAELAAGGIEDFVIAGGDFFHLLSIVASTPAWVRVYGTSAARAADTRTEPGAPIPASGSEYYAEVVTTQSPQTVRFSPVPLVQGTSGSAFIRVGNRDTVARAITLQFTTLKLGD